MKLNYEFEITEVGDEILAVPVGERAAQFRGVVKLNTYAADIMRLLKEETTAEQIVSELMTRYTDSRKEDVAALVEQFLVQLKDAKLLTE